MKMLNSLAATTYQDLIDFDVVDGAGDSIGSLNALWTDRDNGQLEFLGVKTGWIFGSNHVVPIDKVQIDEANRQVRLPYTADFIKGAMTIDADSEITEAQEAEIHRYYGDGGHVATGSRTTTATTAAAATGATAATGANLTADRRTETGVTTGKAGETIDVALREEQLKVGKRTVEAGAVRLRKIIRTEVVNQPVELKHEEIVVERVPASEIRAGGAGDIAAFEGKDIPVPLRKEEAVVAKEAVVTGAVRVRKTEDVETQTVSDTVRKEDVQVDKSGMGVTATETAAKR